MKRRRDWAGHPSLDLGEGVGDMGKKGSAEGKVGCGEGMVREEGAITEGEEGIGSKMGGESEVAGGVEPKGVARAAQGEAWGCCGAGFFQREGEGLEGEARRVWKVSELSAAVKRMVEREFGQVVVEGEVTNLSKSQAGHFYFNLSEGGAVLACAMFARDARRVDLGTLRDGAAIRATGELTTYEGRSQYQLVVRGFELVGRGALLERLERLKRRLQAEGLFDAGRKRALPAYPRCVGVVTSPQAAALSDFLRVLWGRNPHVAVVLSGCAVQGEGAAVEIAAAIRRLGELPAGVPRPEVIVVTRGGGSLEDLWEFNEEVVARAIAASPIPVISAVGHEVDYTIADFVADVRAATPSNAAEIVSARAVELRNNLLSSSADLQRIVSQRLRQLHQHLQTLHSRPNLRYPDRVLAPYYQRLDAISEKIDIIIQKTSHRLLQRLAQASSILRAYHPSRWASDRRKSLADLTRRLQSTSKSRLDALRAQLSAIAQILNALSPLQSLERGYTLTFDSHGRLLKSAAAAAAAPLLLTRFADGNIHSIPSPPPSPPPPPSEKNPAPPATHAPS